MEKEDFQLLLDWFEQNKDHEMNFLEKEAIKAVLRKARTVGDLMETALLRGGLDALPAALGALLFGLLLYLGALEAMGICS